MWITAVMMVAEVAAGYFYNSMALLADGFHMSSHVSTGTSKSQSVSISKTRKRCACTRAPCPTAKASGADFSG